MRQRARQWAKRLAVDPTRIEIGELGYRWGSCSKDGGLNFHWATMLLPSSLVEYVIVRELVHLYEPNHTPEFWQRLQRAMPGYEERKAWLAEHVGGGMWCCSGNVVQSAAARRAQGPAQ